MYFFLFAGKENREFYKKLKSIIGFAPKNLDIYQKAFIHSSVNFVKCGEKVNNERLEFVGDAIINSVVSDLLYRTFPKADEGELSIFRSRIVNRENLNKLAADIKLREIINYIDSKNIDHKYLDGNALEALIGAIYLDRGYKYCYLFISELLDKYMDILSVKDKNNDYKSSFLQYIQKHKIDVEIHTYENYELNEKKHHFLCEICLDRRYLCSGKGWSKKEAEQNASKEALRILCSTTKSPD